MLRVVRLGLRVSELFVYRYVSQLHAGWLQVTGE